MPEYYTSNDTMLYGGRLRRYRRRRSARTTKTRRTRRARRGYSRRRTVRRRRR